jgi:hypothetical protein
MAQATFTVPSTGVYRSADGRYNLNFTQGDIVPLETAVLLQMSGAAAQQAANAAADAGLTFARIDDVEAEIAEEIDPLAVLDISDDFLGGGSATSGSIGELGWIFAGGTFAVGSAPAGHPGVYRRDTGAVTTTTAYARLTSNLRPSDLFDETWEFRLNTNDADTRVRMGLSSDWATDTPVAAIYVEKKLADTEWFGAARAASTETRTAALDTVDTDWHTARMRRTSASAVAFSIDGGAEVSVSTNVPTTDAVYIGMQIFNNAAASKTVDLDCFRMRVTGLER